MAPLDDLQPRGPRKEMTTTTLRATPPPAHSRQRPATLHLHESLFAEASAIIRAEYASELRIRDVARRIATSPRVLQRAFVTVGGTTFREYVRAIRMEAGAALLRSTSLTVGQVSRRVGYRQQAQFAKTFRRHAGVGPIEYRRRSRAVAAAGDGSAEPTLGVAPVA